MLRGLFRMSLGLIAGIGLYAAFCIWWTNGALQKTPPNQITFCVTSRDNAALNFSSRSRIINFYLARAAIKGGGRWGSSQASWHFQLASVEWLGMLSMSAEEKREAFDRIMICASQG
jgi:hypothetical protein